ncbi:MAG: hypothetical protein ABI758_04470 [Candidatus Woesebacteria bacterium]
MTEVMTQEAVNARAEAVKNMTGYEPNRVYVPEFMEIFVLAAGTWVEEANDDEDAPYAY